MTRLLHCIVMIGSVGVFSVVGCGDDESDGTSEGQGASGASTGTGTGGGSTSTGGNGGLDPGDCTVITVDNVKLELAGSYVFWYRGLPTPALGGAGDDKFQLEVYDSHLTGTIDLGAGDQTNYETCYACVLVQEDISEDGFAARYYFQAGGTLELGNATATAAPTIRTATSPRRRSRDAKPATRATCTACASRRPGAATSSSMGTTPAIAAAA